MLIKVLYVILVLSFLALVGVAIASYVRVRKHLKQKPRASNGDIPKQS